MKQRCHKETQKALKISPNPSFPKSGIPPFGGGRLEGISQVIARYSLMLLVMLISFMSNPFAIFAEDRWPGIDKTVVEKFAKEQGREVKESLINTDQGDLLLFAFLIAGTIGGFAAGYYWRVLMERKKDKE